MYARVYSPRFTIILIIPSSLSFLLFREFNFGRRLSIPYSRIHTVCVPFFYLPLPLCPLYFDLFFRSKAFIMSTSAGDLELMERHCFKRWRRSQSTDKLPFEEIFRSLPPPFKAYARKREKKKKEKLFTKMFRPFTMQPVCSFVELRTRHQLIANHDTANARASPCP